MSSHSEVKERSLEQDTVDAVNVAQEAAEGAGLIYVTDQQPGITRLRMGEKEFKYAAHGKPITNPKVLDRIRKLAIPPAYEDVWIRASSNGHIQATGRDAKGRKQYRYHEKFRQIRDGTKYEHMLEFAAALPAIRAFTSYCMSFADARVTQSAGAIL